MKIKMYNTQRNEKKILKACISIGPLAFNEGSGVLSQRSFGGVLGGLNSFLEASK